MNFDEVEWDFGNEMDGVQIHFGTGGSDDGGGGGGD